MDIKINVMYRDRAEKIMSFKTWSTTKKIDNLLEIDATQYTNLGSDSTKSERQSAKITSRYIYRLIKSIDTKLGTLLLRDSLERYA